MDDAGALRKLVEGLQVRLANLGKRHDQDRQRLRELSRRNDEVRRLLRRLLEGDADPEEAARELDRQSEEQGQNLAAENRRQYGNRQTQTC